MDKKARNAEYIKEYNRRLILKFLLHSPMSRAEIARQTGLSRAAITIITSELMEEGLIFESKPLQGARGRTSTLLEIKPGKYYAIGVYLNRDGCTVGVVDLSGDILISDEIDIAGKTDRVASIRSGIEALIERSNLPKSNIRGIGISAPGPLDGVHGKILNPPRFTDWHETDIVKILEKPVGLPVYLENNAKGLSSHHYYRNKINRSENFLLLLVDSGVGSGVVTKGKLLKSEDFFTGELGHISICYHGRICACGNIGCLEEYAAMPKLLANTPYSSWQQVMDKADSQEEAAQILQRETEYLGTAVASLTNLIRIDTVLLAGDILYGADRFAPMLEKYINQHVFHLENKPIRVLPSSDNPKTRILSAADIVFEKMLSV